MNIRWWLLALAFFSTVFTADMPENRYYSKKRLNEINNTASINNAFVENQDLPELKRIYYSLVRIQFKQRLSIGEIVKGLIIGVPNPYEKLYKQVIAILPEKLIMHITGLNLDRAMTEAALQEYQQDISLFRFITQDKAAFSNELTQIYNKKVSLFLKRLALCPIFVGLKENPKFHELINLKTSSPAPLAAMNENDQIAYEIEKASGVDLWLKTTFADNSERLACFVNYTPPLKNGDGIVRQIIQIRSVNQSIGKFKKMGTQHCSGLSLRNAICLNEYAKSGAAELLRKLYNEDGAIKFLEDYECKERIEKNDIENNKYFKTFPQMRKHIAVIDSPLVLDQKHQEALTTSSIDEITRIKSYIRSGLSQPDFYFSFIVGTLDERALSQQLPEHWYCFSIIKKGHLIQYIVVDTAADYHLQQGSYELMRLHYFIDLLEQGSSEIVIPEQSKQ